MKEYSTTYGELRWDETASSVLQADDPIEPPGDGWRLVSSVLGELRYSVQTILWFWEREVPKATETRCSKCGADHGEWRNAQPELCGG